MILAIAILTIFEFAIEMKKLVIIGSLMSAFAVILGAFGAHTLKELISETELQTFEIGVKYHIIHSVAILIAAILYQISKNKKFITAGYLMFTGILLFSFSLYLLSIKNIIGLESTKLIGPITPIGGLFLISAWLLIFWSATKLSND